MITSSYVFIKLINPLLKLFGVGAKIISKNFHGFRLLKSVGITIDKEQFDQVYFASITAYESSLISYPEFLQVLKESTVIMAFKNDLYNEDDTQHFITELDTIIHVKNKYTNLKQVGIDIITEATNFVNLFHTEVGKTRNPKEKETHDKVVNI